MSQFVTPATEQIAFFRSNVSTDRWHLNRVITNGIYSKFKTRRHLIRWSVVKTASQPKQDLIDSLRCHVGYPLQKWFAYTLKALVPLTPIRAISSRNSGDVHLQVHLSFYLGHTHLPYKCCSNAPDDWRKLNRRHGYIGSNRGRYSIYGDSI